MKYIRRRILLLMLCILGLSCIHAEAALNSGNVKVTSHRLSSATTFDNAVTWAVSEDAYIPLGTEMSLCWDSIGLDLHETGGLSVTITDPAGKKYSGLCWTIDNHYDPPGLGILGWSYIKESHLFFVTCPFTHYHMDTASLEKGVLFLGYASILPGEEDPTGEYTGVIKITAGGEEGWTEELTTSWYVVDTPIGFTSILMDQTVREGEPVTFAASATGSHLSYQWFYNTTDTYEGGTAIEGATQPTLTLEEVPADYDGRYYYCQVSNYSSTSAYEQVTKTTSRALLTVNKDKLSPAAPSSATTETKTKTNLTINKKGKLLSAKSTAKKKIAIRWKKLTGISGYQICLSRSKNFKKNLIKRTYQKAKTKAVITNLVSGKYYYVKIRPYKIKAKKTYYGKWSKVKKAKIK